ncbi:type II toxin-antitoxin system RelE/ParE family toxin [Actinokineospora sp.]|uniref:type II toxin-antitoxin system RelE/ParE family toxin n=1 Tax=Actinokineospora sp. TaxID=1872133 RepID=UPI003D6C3D45
MVVGWDVELHDEVASWFERLCELDPESADLVEQAIDVLAREGPRLGRPLVGRVKGPRFHNMKELRPASAGANTRSIRPRCGTLQGRTK